MPCAGIDFTVCCLVQYRTVIYFQCDILTVRKLNSATVCLRQCQCHALCPVPTAATCV